jgi:uncharacterized protein (DUF1330 family)
MKLICATAFAVVAAATAFSAATVQATHARAKPMAYVVNEIDVTDPDAFKAYAERQGTLIKSFGGQFLARGGKAEALAGAALHQRTVIYVFEDMDHVRAWRDAPEQKELTALRDKSSNFRSFTVEGCADCRPPSGR